MSFEALIPNQFVSTPFSAGDYSSDSGSWTVASGDVTANQWMKINPKLLIWNIAIAATSAIAGSPAYVSIKLPNGMTTPFPAGSFTLKPAYVFNNGVEITNGVVQVNDSTHIILHTGGGAFVAGNFACYFTITMGVD